MATGPRSTAGINTTKAQEKFRGQGLKKPIQVPGPVLGPAPQPSAQEAESSTFMPVAQTREIADQGMDEFALYPDECKALGIGDDEEHGWIRDPRYWKGREPGDRAREFLRQNPGGEIVYYKGEMVTNGSDLILVKRKKALVEEVEKREAAREREMDRRISNEILEDDEFNPKDPRAIEERKHRNTLEHIRRGLIGPQSPSSGLAYEDYVKWRGLSAADIEAEERSYSLRGMTERQSVSDEEVVAAAQSHRRQRDRAEERASDTTRDDKGRFYSLPPTIRPRNLMKNPARS